MSTEKNKVLLLRYQDALRTRVENRKWLSRWAQLDFLHLLRQSGVTHIQQG